MLPDEGDRVGFEGEQFTSANSGSCQQDDGETRERIRVVFCGGKQFAGGGVIEESW